MMITGMPLATAFWIGPLNTSGSASVVMMPSGLDAADCSMMRAMSAMSPVGGLRYSTLAPTCSPASARPFLMVFHQESESGAWLTRMNRSPSALAPTDTPNTEPAVIAHASNTFFKDFIRSYPPLWCPGGTKFSRKEPARSYPIDLANSPLKG